MGLTLIQLFQVDHKVNRRGSLEKLAYIAGWAVAGARVETKYCIQTEGKTAPNMPVVQKAALLSQADLALGGVCII